MDTKGWLAILVTTGSFLLLGVYVLRNETPPPVVAAFVSGGQMLVLGFYFGHVNGAATELAKAATRLAQAAIDKRDSG